MEGLTVFVFYLNSVTVIVVIVYFFASAEVDDNWFPRRRHADRDTPSKMRVKNHQMAPDYLLINKICDSDVNLNRGEAQVTWSAL